MTLFVFIVVLVSATLHAGWNVAANGLLHAGYFGVLARAYAVGEMSLVYPVARGTGVAGTAIVAAAWLQESLSLRGLGGIAAICVGTGLVGFNTRSHQDEGTGYLHALLVGATITSYSIIDTLAVGRLHPVIYISGMFSLAAL